MRRSKFLIPTLKEEQSEATLVSHQLMLRSGMIKKLASGLYTWLPLGMKVLNKVTKIVKEEMDKISNEILMPFVQPKELWDESNRWEEIGPQLLKIEDRHNRDFCLGPTHEEVVTDIARRDLQSYKQLPVCVYQAQIKFRDEIRPRFGVMRSREFIMKDAYSFHLDEECLANTYKDMFDAYSNIFSKLGLEFRAVDADTGAIGGNASQEFHVITEAGEDALAFSTDSDYAANLEKATFQFEYSRTEPTKDIEKVTTPKIYKTTEQAKYLKVNISKFLKTYIVEGVDEEPVALIIRADHTLNEIKAAKLESVKSPLTLVSEEKLKEISGCSSGFVGPVGLEIKLLADRDVSNMSDFYCGANIDDTHYANVNWGVDCREPEFVDIRNVVEGDKSPDGKGTLKIKRGVEVGHIFQLGSKYSEAMGATILDKNGKAVHLKMGCYGLGISRLVAAAIEQNNDENGIIWPEQMAPFHVVLIGIGVKKDENVRQACEDLYEKLTSKGISVLFDDRDERPGIMFADSELIGIPHRVVISKKTLADNAVEYKNRTGKDKEIVQLDQIVNFIKGI